MEQFIWGASQASFIWEDAEASGEASVTCADEPSDEADLPRIVVLANDEDEDEAAEPDDDWRRQLISALQDSDREKSSPPPLPELEVGPPLPYVPPAQRLPPRTFARPTRIAAPAPIERSPRNRAGISLLGVSAAAGLLAAALPQSTNVQDSAIAASPPFAFTSVHAKVPTEDGNTFKPVMFNSPVLVREGGTPPASPASAQQPAIEMVRTIPVQLGREAQAAQSPTVVETRADLPPEPTLTLKPEFAPEPAPPPLDRNSLAALTTEPPASLPPMLAPPGQTSITHSAAHAAPERTAAISPSLPAAPPQAARAEPPAPAAPERSAAIQAPPPTSSSVTRTPQISTAVESEGRKPPRQAARKKPKAASKTATKTAAKTKSTTTKTAARAPNPQWESRRQGLRTTPPPPAEEPSTVTKLLKSLWPFSSGDDAAAAKAKASQRRSEAPQPARTQNSAWSGDKDR